MGETSIIPKDRSAVSKSVRTGEAIALITEAIQILRPVPNLEIEEVDPEPAPAGNQLDFSFLVSYGHKKFKIAGEVKSSGEPSVLRRSAAWLKDLVTKTEHDYAVIIAPFISREGTEICRELGVGFIDLSGNCLFNLEGLYIERTGYPNKFKNPREIQSLFSPKSSRVIRCLLSDPARAWTLKGLAVETGVSIGLIHRIATALESNLFAKKDIRAFKLEDPARLLEAWREEYYRRAPKWARYVVGGGAVEGAMSKLDAAAIRCGIRYAISGPSGALLVFSDIPPTAVYLYVDALKQEFLQEIEADRVSSEGNLLIRIVEQENEFIGSREVKGLDVVSDLQLYLDLWAMGGRGQDAAEELRRECFHF